MKRKKPLRRKTPPKSKTGIKRSGRLAPFSKLPRKVLDQKLYRITRRAYLKDHPRCELDPMSESVEIHHKAKRRGVLLWYPKYFMAVCRKSHEWIEGNKAEARKLNWIIDFSSEEYAKIKIEAEEWLQSSGILKNLTKTKP